MSNFSIRQLGAPGLWHVKYTGVVTGATRNEALSAFVRMVEEQGSDAQDVRGQDVRGIVVDLRGTDMQISVAEAYAFGARLAKEPGLGTCRLVFLENDEHTERSKFLETVALNRGRQARVMADWDGAVAWLGGQNEMRSRAGAPDADARDACNAPAADTHDARNAPDESGPLLTKPSTSRPGRFLRPGVPGGSL